MTSAANFGTASDSSMLADDRQLTALRNAGQISLNKDPSIVNTSDPFTLPSYSVYKHWQCIMWCCNGFNNCMFIAAPPFSSRRECDGMGLHLG